MIISHKYKFIFLKTRKTAGTSLEIALSEFCGPEDIITPISPEDEQVRKELGYRSPQNCCVSLTKYSLKDWQETLLRKKKPRFHNHIPASLIRRWVGPKTWDSYYKFCFERNPWDKAISLYYYVKGAEGLNITFQEYIGNAKREHLSNFHIYEIDNKIAVDHVGLYEKLDDELEFISKKIGLPKGLSLLTAKGNFRTDRRPYQEVIDENERRLILEICSKEVEAFNYSF